MVEAQDARVFSQGACHVFAHVLKKRFGYRTFGVKKTTKSYSHVYCLGRALAVDVSGKRDEDDVLADWQQYEGMYSRADSLQFREEVNCERLFEADHLVTGLLSERKFLADAINFADKYVTENAHLYENA